MTTDSTSETASSSYSVNNEPSPPLGGSAADSKKKYFPILRKLGGASDVRAEFAKIKSEMKHQKEIVDKFLNSCTSSADATPTTDNANNLVEEAGDEDVPSDNFLKEKMQILLTKKLANVSIGNYYDICWSEGENPYGSWLTSMGKTALTVGKWEEGEFVEDISGEKFAKHRVVTFSQKTAAGVASVTNTQYCRLEGDDKCVVAMSVQTEGIPYGESFVVSVRWAATRMGKLKHSSKIQIGVYVNFLKSTIFEGKIRSGVVESTLQQQSHLFETFKNACSNTLGDIIGEDEDQAEVLQDTEAKPVKSRQNVNTFLVEFLNPKVLFPVFLSVLIMYFWGRKNISGDVLLLTQVEDIKSTLQTLIREIQGLQKEAEAALKTVNEIVAAKQIK